jgi:hypothetical protein
MDDDPNSLRARAARLREMARSSYGDHRDTLIAAAAELVRQADALDRDASERPTGELTGQPLPGPRHKPA